MFDLKRYRLDNNMSQSDLAAKIGVDQGRVSRYETGIHSESLEERLVQKIGNIDSYHLDNAPTTTYYIPLREGKKMSMTIPTGISKADIDILQGWIQLLSKSIK